jgi:hypothetical protein
MGRFMVKAQATASPKRSAATIPADPWPAGGGLPWRGCLGLIRCHQSFYSRLGDKRARRTHHPWRAIKGNAGIGENPSRHLGHQMRLIGIIGILPIAVPVQRRPHLRGHHAARGRGKLRRLIVALDHKRWLPLRALAFNLGRRERRARLPVGRRQARRLGAPDIPPGPPPDLGKGGGQIDLAELVTGP